MANSKWRKINEFFVVSEIGKQQSGLGVFLDDGDLDTRENAEMESDLEIERGVEYNCDQVDLVGEPVKRRYRRFRLTYNNPTPEQIFRMVAYKEGSVTAPTGTPADEVQTLSRTGTVSGGTFNFAFTLEGKTGNVDIPYDATAAAIKTLITNPASQLGKIVRKSDLNVGGDWTGGIVLTFVGRLAKANMPLAVINNTNITGGGTVGAVETTPGANKFHTAQRSADGTKPLFSFATGERSEAIATTKYGDAVVESIDFTLANDSTNVTMQVVIACNFNPDLPVAFPVPPCVNLPSVLTVDCRLKIAGNFENRDLVNHAISLNDNVPIEAAFAYDDYDFTDAPVRGDKPTQEFTTELYGDSSASLHVLALDEVTDGNEVEFITYLGNPGNRVNIIAAKTKIKPQTQLDGNAGPARFSTIKIIGTPYGTVGIPVTFEAYLSQTATYLSV